MQKITITIDPTKINKNKITKRTYTNKDGEEVTVTEYKMDVVEKKEPRLIKDGDTWRLEETHFVAEHLTKEDRANGEENNHIGAGTQFVDKIQELHDEIDEEIDPNEIPF